MCERCLEQSAKRDRARDQQRQALVARAEARPAAAASGAPATTTATSATGANKRAGSVQPDAAARPEDLQGVLKGPHGPLRQWPFRLLRDGTPVDAKALGAKGAVPESRGGLWLSDRQGRYRFAGVPAGSYRVEIVRPGAKLEPAQAAAPALDPGHRAAPPPLADHHAAESCELPETPEIPGDFDL